MLNETYIRRLSKIIKSAKDEEVAVEKVVYLTNELKEDIAQAITEKSQNSGVANFISVPEAIEIISHGGIATTRESLELVVDLLEDGEDVQAKDIIKRILGGEE